MLRLGDDFAVSYWFLPSESETYDTRTFEPWASLPFNYPLRHLAHWDGELNHEKYLDEVFKRPGYSFVLSVRDVDNWDQYEFAIGEDYSGLPYRTEYRPQPAGESDHAQTVHSAGEFAEAFSRSLMAVKNRWDVRYYAEPVQFCVEDFDEAGSSTCGRYSCDAEGCLVAFPGVSGMRLTIIEKPVLIFPNDAFWSVINE